jgi:hypothetical protein
VDPWEGGRQDPQSLHKYAYAHADPVNSVDPLGLGEFSLTQMLTVSAIVGLVATLATIAYGQLRYRGIAARLRGTIVHEYIFTFYRAHGFKCNRWIATSKNPPMDRHRPDCRHHGPGPFMGQVYEIKSSREVVLGGNTVRDYIITLKKRYPSVPWHPGTILLAPPVVKIPKFPAMNFYLAIPEPGVITYEASPDYVLAAQVGIAAAAVTLMALMLNAGAKGLVDIGRPVPQPVGAY